MALPKLIHVREDKEQDGTYLSAFSGGLQAAVEDDGPTEIGVYQLVRRLRVVKQTKIVKETKPR